MLVLIWHLKPLRIFAIDPSTILLSNKILGQFYAKTLLAVPIFYFVSLLLFFKKNILSNNYIIKRSRRILNIFVFWSAVQIIVYYIVKNISLILQIHINFSPNNSHWWWWLIMGGPSLPSVGDSVFYFLFNLFLLTLFAFFYAQIASKYIDIIVFSLSSIYLLFHQFFFKIPYWRIDNFIIYVPMAHFIANNYLKNIIEKKYFILSVLVFIFFSTVELVFRKLFNTQHSAYDLNSLQWGVISLYILVYLYNLKRNSAIKFLSTYSLGLFALHKYWQLFFLSLFTSMQLELHINISGTYIDVKYILIFVLTMFMTCVTVSVMNKSSILKKYVS